MMYVLDCNETKNAVDLTMVCVVLTFLSLWMLRYYFSVRKSCDGCTRFQSIEGCG